MAQTKFYRGTALPNTISDGSIYIIDLDNETTAQEGVGRLYVDINNNRRLAIGGSDVQMNTAEELQNNNVGGIISKEGRLYILVEEQNNIRHQVGVRIGDGLAYVRDLPLYKNFSQEQADALNESITVGIAQDDAEKIVFN